MLTWSIYLCRTEFEFETVTDFEFEIEFEIFCEYQPRVMGPSAAVGVLFSPMMSGWTGGQQQKVTLSLKILSGLISLS